MKALQITFILALSLIIFLLPISLYIGFLSLRKPIYKTLVVQSGLFSTEENVKEAVDSLVHGLLTTTKIEFPSAGIALTDSEQIHMRDVSYLLKFNWILGLLLLTGFIFSLIILLKTKSWILLRQSSIIASILFLIILGLGLFSFEGLFTLFHQVLFRNDLWLLPQDSILLQLFPADFFFRQFITIVMSSFVWFAALYIVSIRQIKGRLK